MSFYIGVINEAIEYIEDSICEKITLADVSGRFKISDFHFNRLFKTIVGISLKQYILGRKLMKALDLLKSTNRSIIDIALELGFEYPEVFSRDFKKQFGMSPSYFREKQPLIKRVPKACIVERDIINYRGTLALKGHSIYLDELVLRGISTDVNENNGDFEAKLRLRTENFLLSARGSKYENDEFYTVVNCSGHDDGGYTVFCGRNFLASPESEQMQVRTVPEGWYVNFNYQGDMFNIKEAFITDLYKWVMVKDVELNPNGVGMLNIYKDNYPDTKSVRILVPVKRPV